MDGFTSYFDDAAIQYKNSVLNLEGFRYNRNVYGFCINQEEPDNMSLNYSLDLNKELTTRFINQPKGIIGYKNNEEKYTKLDDLDCKHILQLTFLFNNNTTNYNRIVEIGAGYGNMLRLCNNIISYKNWDIIDIPHMLELQKFYLTNESLDTNKIQFIDAYSNVNYNNKSIDLVIGTHSLSEFSWDIFYNYFINVIRNSKYFYMGYNKNCPSPYLINKKLEYILNNGFIIEKNFDYTELQGANVSYTLYKNINQPPGI